MSGKDERINVDGMEFVVISSYTLEQALADDVLHTFAREQWDTVSGGKPIVMTDAIYRKVYISKLVRIWNAFVTWRREVMPALPEEEQLFVATFRGEDIWVIEDGAAFTILCPSDY
jgi:hypothetical protein